MDAELFLTQPVESLSIAEVCAILSLLDAEMDRREKEEELLNQEYAQYDTELDDYAVGFISIYPYSEEDYD